MPPITLPAYPGCDPPGIIGTLSALSITNKRHGHLYESAINDTALFDWDIVSTHSSPHNSGGHFVADLQSTRSIPEDAS